MKKVICSMMLALGFAFAANAQIVPPDPGGDPRNNANQADNRVKGSPLAPATLLLLGLAGGFAGVKVYRNNKKREE